MSPTEWVMLISLILPLLRILNILIILLEIKSMHNLHSGNQCYNDCFFLCLLIPQCIKSPQSPGPAFLFGVTPAMWHCSCPTELLDHWCFRLVVCYQSSLSWLEHRDEGVRRASLCCTPRMLSFLCCLIAVNFAVQRCCLNWNFR